MRVARAVRLLLGVICLMIGTFLTAAPLVTWAILNTRRFPYQQESQALLIVSFLACWFVGIGLVISGLVAAFSATRCNSLEKKALP